MNRKEAFEIFGISASSTKEEIKKKYKELAKIHHPDRSKEKDDSKFKKINEAYEILQQDNKVFYDKPKVYNRNDVQVSTSISFKESVFGAQRNIKLKRTIKCGPCNGMGKVRKNNGCTVCNGQGQTVQQNGNMHFIVQCPTCQGVSTIGACNLCDQNGFVESETNVNVSIPPGIKDQNILRLANLGNYCGSFMGMDQVTNAFVNVSVAPEEGLTIDGEDVISTLSLTMLDALNGCQRQVKTVNGDVQVVVPKLSRNREEVKIPNLGVAGKGSQRVIFDVAYPDNTDKLIEVLKDS